MILKTKKTWIYALAVICFMLLAAVGAVLCAPKTQAAHAAASVSTPLTSTAGGDLASGSYHLNGDLELDATLTIPVTTTASLDLNGHILKLKEGVSGSVIRIDGGTFTIRDSAQDTEHPGMDIKGGVITGGTGSTNWGDGGGVLINFGYDSSDATVYGTFTMDGGTIYGNTVSGDGGGVWINSRCTFTMNEGVIYGNSAYNGGGVFVSGGTFNMSDGTVVSDNVSSYRGGGVYISGATGTFNMSGGTVSGNTSSRAGGGVYVNGGNMYVSGAPKIIGNKKEEVVDDCYLGSTDIKVVGELTSGAKIGIDRSSGIVATGFTQTTGKVTDFFVPNSLKTSCIYVSDAQTGTVSFDKHEFDDTTLVCSYCGNKAAFAVWKPAYDGGISYHALYELAEKFSDTSDRSISKFVLLSDIKISETLVSKRSWGSLLYLNGYKLEHTGTGAAIQTEVGSELRINDAISTIDGEDGADTLAGLASKNAENTVTYYTSDTETATTNINGGVITGGKNSGVYAKGDLTIFAGSISGNRGFDGGGVHVEGGTLQLYTEGAISYNYAGQYGGGVRLDGGTIDVRGGKISNNIAQHSGGGIDQKADESSTVNINFGFISDNKAIDGSYGGLCVEKNTTFTMSGGTISGNTAKLNGGGIGIISTKPATISGGEISGNSATSACGGGVYIGKAYDIAPTVTISGGKISGNSAGYLGGGVYVNDGTFNISGAPEITGNTAGNGANNNVCLTTAVMTVTGALKDGNKTAKIGVTLLNGTGDVTSGYGANNKVDGNVVPPQAYFVSDDDSLVPVLKAGEVYLSYPVTVTENGYVTTGYASVSDALKYVNTLTTTTENAPAVIKLFADDSFSLAVSLYSDKYAELDLNGHCIVGESCVSVSGYLTLTDSDPTAEHKYDVGSGGKYVFSDSGAETLFGGLITGCDRSGVKVTRGTFVMIGGNIAGNSALIGGGGVYVDGGTFTMSGTARICGNTAKDSNGGGVILKSGTFTMLGGTISDNSTTGSGIGGGVYVEGGTFNMSDGTISDNSTTGNGGGVYVNGGTFNMSGGKISGNSAIDATNGCGGGVYVNGGTFNMGGGTIGGDAEAKANVSNFGGGVRINAGATFVMTDGAIKHNSAQKDGGGLCVFAAKKVELGGGEISHNRAENGGGIYFEGITKGEDGVDPPEDYVLNGTAVTNNETAHGGGIYIDGSTVTMRGGKISGNTADRGGGVYLDIGTFKMSGGVISGNTAKQTGGGVRVSGGTFEISGAVTVTGNKTTVTNGSETSEIENNVYLEALVMTVTGALKDGNKATAIGVTLANGTGAVTSGYGENNKDDKGAVISARTYFVSDDGSCVKLNVISEIVVDAHDYSADFTVDTAPTCLEKGSKSRHCNYCDSVIAVTDISALGHDIDGLAVVNGRNEYTAFDEFVLTGAEVYTHCSHENCDCEGGRVKKIDNNTVTTTYATSDKYLHCADKKVTLKATVDGKELSVDYDVDVSKYGAEVIWEYTVSPVSEESAWEWKEITDGSYFIYDGTQKNHRVRARFTGADNDPDKDKYFYRATSDAVFVYDIELVGTYNLYINNISDYYFINSDATIEVKPYEISLDDADVYRWTLGKEQGSLLRDGYVKEVDGVWMYYANEITGGEHVTRSIVRYRGDETNLSIMLNGGEIADLFGVVGVKRSVIEYSGTVGVGAIGMYTAIATLELNDKDNYIYTGAISVATDRGMTIEITENGTKAVITKIWYVAAINNGLLNVTGGEYRISGWQFGQNVTAPVPMLENGDEGFDVGNISKDDKRISFELFTDADLTKKIGQTFYRYNLGDYINGSMPSGSYYVRATVTGVTDGDGVVYQDFTRTFTFGVQKAELEIADSLSGKTFEHSYNGEVQLFGDKGPTVTAPKYLKSDDRIGVWKNAEFDKYYGEAYITYHLARWHNGDGTAHEYVTITQLSNTLGKKQAPREVDTYTVYYRINALNYNSYGTDNDKTFTVTIVKNALTVPSDKEVTYNGERQQYTVADDAPYKVSESVAYVAANTDGYAYTLELKDAENYEWKGVSGNTVTVKLIINKARYDMGGVTFGGLDVLYDGNEHKITVSGLPEGVTYVIVGATSVGEHNLTVAFSGDGKNYEAIPSIPVTMIIRTPQLVKPNENDGEINDVIVITPEGFKPNIQLVVTEIAQDSYGNYDAIAQAANGVINHVYDVTLKSNGVSVQPDGTLTIKLLIPTDLRGKDFKLFHLHETQATETEYTVDGNYAVVTTDKLSEFIFVGEKTARPTPDDNNVVWLVLIIILAVVIACEICYIVLRKTGKIKFGGEK